MRLLVLASSFNRFGGPNGHLLDLCNALADSGLDVSVATQSGPMDPVFSGEARFPILGALPPAPSTIPGRGRVLWRTARAIRRLGDSWRPSIVMVNASLDTALAAYLVFRRPILIGWNVFLNALPRSTMRRWGVPPYFGTWETRAFQLGDRCVARHITGKVLAHTEFQRSLYAEIGIPPERTEVIPHGVDSMRLQRWCAAGPAEPAGMAGGAIRVLFGGRLERWKGVTQLLQACREASDRCPIHLTFVGRGSCESELRAQSSNAGASFRVDVKPWSNGPEFAREIAIADVVAMPSFELFGMVVIEAMALGKPVLAAATPGPSEIITDGRDGLLVPFKDQRAISESLARLSDPATRRRLGEAAKLKVKERFEAVKVAAQVKALLQTEEGTA